MPIKNPLRCILLWLILILMMILHFNYHVGELFYGIDVARENANGVVPVGTHVIRNVFYHLPIIWILILLFSSSKIILKSLFVISIVYTLSHTAHLIGEFQSPDLSQGPLLILTLIISIILSFEHYKYMKKEFKEV